MAEGDITTGAGYPNAYEIDVTTFLNLMVVLVPFLLITAVFSRMTIVELTCRVRRAARPATQTVFVSKSSSGKKASKSATARRSSATIPKQEEEFDLDTLSDLMVALKQEYPDQECASVLMEAQIPYDYLIQVMDAVRSVEVPTDIEDEFELYALFTEISVGEAP